MRTPSLRVAEYCETFDAITKGKNDGSITPAVEDVLCDKLDELWRELTVDEVREVEARYPAIKLARLA